MPQSPKLTFGKFKGRTLSSLLNTPEGLSYVRWLAAWQAANTSNTAIRNREEWSALAKQALRKAGL